MMDLYDIEKEMTQLLLWIKTMRKQEKDTTQLAHIYRMLEDSLAIRYNMKKRVEQLRALKRAEALRREQLRFLYNQETESPLVNVPKNVVRMLRQNNLNEINQIKP
jgi:hypothetical protein